jgi:hypothetical protein
MSEEKTKQDPFELAKKMGEENRVKIAEKLGNFEGKNNNFEEIKKEIDGFFDSKEIDNYIESTGRSDTVEKYKKEIEIKVKNLVKEGEGIDLDKIILNLMAEKSKTKLAKIVIEMVGGRKSKETGGEKKDGKLEKEFSQERNRLEKLVLRFKNKLHDFLEEVSQDDSTKDSRKKFLKVVFDLEDRKDKLLEKEVSAETLEEIKKLCNGLERDLDADLAEMFNGLQEDQLKNFDKNWSAQEIREKLKKANFKKEELRDFMDLKEDEQRRILGLEDEDTKSEFYKILEDKSKNLIKEGESDKESEKYEAKLTQEEKKDSLEFFEKNILPLYELRKKGEGWSGYSKDTADFLKKEFFEVAQEFNYLDGDSEKIDLAWREVANVLEEEISKIEAKDIKKTKKSNEEYIDEYQESIKSSKKKERKNEEFEELQEVERALEDARRAYVRKKLEIEKDSGIFRKFFKKEIDLGNIEEELDLYKERYLENLGKHKDLSLKNNPGENVEAMINYYSKMEFLRLEEDRIDIKEEDNPRLAVLKNFFNDRVAEYRGLSLKKKLTYGVALSATGMAAFAGGGVTASVIAAAALTGKRALGLGASTAGFKMIFDSKSEKKFENENKENIDKITNFDASNRGKELDNFLQDKISNLDKEFEKRSSIRFRNTVSAAVATVLLSASFSYAGEVVSESDVVKNVIDYFKGSSDDVSEKAENLMKDGDYISPAEITSEDPKSTIGGGKNIDEIMKAAGVKEVTPATEASAANDASNLEDAGKAIEGIKNDNAQKENSIGNRESIYKTMEESGAEESDNSSAATGVSPNVAAKDVEIDKLRSVDDVVKDVEKGVIKNDNDNNGIENDAERMDSELENQSIQGGQEILAGKEVLVNIDKGSNVKDSLTNFLEKNHERFTEGNMGWDQEKFSSVKEWAEKRAIGIVGEFTEGKDYDYDLVSPDATVRVDFSNPADIKIEEIDDPKNLGALEDISNVTAENPSEGVANAKNLPSVEEAIENIEKENVIDISVKKEMEMAYRTGIAPDHYAEINDVSVDDFIAEAERLEGVSHGGGEDSLMGFSESKLPASDFDGSDDRENARLARILNYLHEDGKLENTSQSVKDALRGVNEDDFKLTIGKYEENYGNVDNVNGGELSSDEWRGEYISSMIKSELREMINSSSGEGAVMKEIAEIRGSSMAEMKDNELLQSFKNVVASTVGNVEHGNSESVGKYILKVIRKTYEIGEMENLRLRLANININN